jgi:hypothetical protein
MKALVVITGVEPTQYVAPQMRTLEALMTEEEKARAHIKGWDLKGVEPGGDEVFTFRVAADSVDKDIALKVFQPAEIDCRGVSGRGWVRNGQTSGSVEATVTFQAVAVRFVDMSVVLEEQKRRQEQAELERERRKAQREFFDQLAKQVQQRLAGQAGGTTGLGEPAAMNSSGKASK